MSKRAFTLIELLVVIAIIAILAAILFPVFAQAKMAAKKSTDLSNLKQLGTAALMYVTDYDDTLVSPALRTCGQTVDRPFGSPVWSKNWVVWTELLYPYTKNKDIFTSPGFTQYPYQGYSINDNSSNDDLPQAYDAATNTGGGTPPGNYLAGSCSVGNLNSPVSATSATSPSNTIWFYDADTNFYQDAPLNWDDAIAWYSGLSASEKASENQPAIDGSEIIAQILLSGGSKVDDSTVITSPHRFSKTMNIAWLDGHAKATRPSQLKGENWNIESVPQGREE